MTLQILLIQENLGEESSSKTALPWGFSPSSLSFTLSHFNTFIIRPNNKRKIVALWVTVGRTSFSEDSHDG